MTGKKASEKNNLISKNIREIRLKFVKFCIHNNTKPLRNNTF